MAFGLAAVLASTVYYVGAEIGHTWEISGADLMMLRCAVGAVVMVPLLLLSQASPLPGPARQG